MSAWAIDLGTTNSGVARWDQRSGQPQLVELTEICRRPDAEDPLEAPRLIPTTVDFVERPGFWARLGAWPPIARRAFVGRTAFIGRPALERNEGVLRASFVPTFKAALAGEALRPVARVGRRTITARQAARVFMRELLAEVKRVTGERIRDLVVTVPVDAFEAYRAEVSRICRALGVRRTRFLDEPVAAALGYGLSLTQDRTVLVVDIGGGTLHLALVRLSPGGVTEGQARVLAKQGRPYGGNAVDGWILADVCREMGWALDDLGDADEIHFWRRLMLAEACRAKEAVFFRGSAAFGLTPPGQTRRLDPRLVGHPLPTLDADRLTRILREAGFYEAIEQCLEAVHTDSRLHVEDVQDVLMIGGSTLLPGVFPAFEQRFGRDRLRAWQPFEAVAYGAASFAAERFSQFDFIVHDYAIVTHDPKTNDPQHVIVVPRGTRFPTRPDLWKRLLVPTCSLGEPETVFKLVICEVGRGDGDGRRFVWDAAGDLHKVGGRAGDNRVVVPLNEANPALGHLDPPHRPGDRRPRLEVAFGVDADRWLIATVQDLMTRRTLMHREPVVRLL
jgi:molecular chaperone DnaK (HSP70)